MDAKGTALYCSNGDRNILVSCKYTYGAGEYVQLKEITGLIVFTIIVPMGCYMCAGMWAFLGGE